jgi:hypothetical protein
MRGLGCSLPECIPECCDEKVGRELSGARKLIVQFTIDSTRVNEAVEKHKM